MGAPPEIRTVRDDLGAGASTGRRCGRDAPASTSPRSSFLFPRIALPAAEAAFDTETKVLRTLALCRPSACLERSDDFCAGIGEAELCIQKCLLWLRHPPTHGYVLHAGGKLGVCAGSRRLVAAQAPIWESRSRTAI